ncbi:MAG: serine hydrolase domain-containing protein [Myxococcota bacterium]|nr:serine hydrolase domain-containing protein [Myxococcota bacterium]
MLLLLLACGPTTPDSAAPDTGSGLPPIDEVTSARLQAALEQVHAELGVPGITAAYHQEGHQVWTGSVGIVDWDTQAAIAPQQPLKAGSITKTVTAAATLQLVEAGDLGLDDGVGEYVPSLAQHEGLQVRHLLNHSSGLEEYPALIEASELSEPWTEEALLALIAEQELRFPPGSQHVYTNANYLVLGLVLEAVTGEDWQTTTGALLQEHAGAQARIPDPAGGWGEIGAGYMLGVPGEPIAVDGEIDFKDYLHNSVLGAAGNMSSDAEGLALWSSALWGSDAVLSEDTLALQVSESMELGGDTAYGLGVVVSQDAYGPLRWHNGAVNGYVAWAGHRPERGESVAVLGNCWKQTMAGWDYTWSTQVADALWEAAYAD